METPETACGIPRLTAFPTHISRPNSQPRIIITAMMTIYPFSAIVGQTRMKRALILNAIDPRIGGVLIRGERGTAKSTAARSLAQLLPEEETFIECRFGCHPDDPGHWCSECNERRLHGVTMNIGTRPTPFVNLPVSATEDRVVGTIDIEKAITTGQKSFEPGILAQANRGILYIDEVNLLEDHVVDLLLDAAAMGVNRVEREGISFEHPAKFILVGTMNPEEGDLRPQLLDRFALSVDIVGITDPHDRVEIMKRTIGYENDPEKFIADFAPNEDALREKIRIARDLVKTVRYTSRDLISIASLTTSLRVEGHRADFVILKTARAQAAFDGRDQINEMDIALAAELALPHRLQKGPLNEQDISADELKVRIEELTGHVGEGEGFKSAEEVEAEQEKKT